LEEGKSRYVKKDKEKVKIRNRLKTIKGSSGHIVILSLLVSAAFSFCAYANGPGQFSSLDDATYARLQDNTAEWDEIQNLVKFYNPTYRLYADSADSTNTELSSAGDAFNEEMDRNLDTIDENLKSLKEQREKLTGLPGTMIIDMKGTTVSQMLKQLDAAEATLKNTRAQLKKGVGQVNTMVTSTRITTEEQMKPVREQIAHAVENLFISYAQLKVNRSLVEKQIELYEKMLNTQENLKAKDMATDADVASARVSLSQAKNTLTTVDNGIDQLRTAIGLQLGWNADNPPSIGEVPGPDLAYPASANKEEDYKEALENNKTYETAGKIETYTGSSALTNRDAAVNEANAKASARFDSLYASMQQQKLLYDTAQTSLKLAELKKGQAERMMNLGMVGSAEYLGLQMQYLSAEASAKLAELSLASAINEYKWAVRGYMDYE